MRNAQWIIFVSDRRWLSNFFSFYISVWFVYTVNIWQFAKVTNAVVSSNVLLNSLRLLGHVVCCECTNFTADPIFSVIRIRAMIERIQKRRVLFLHFIDISDYGFYQHFSLCVCRCLPQLLYIRLPSLLLFIVEENSNMMTQMIRGESIYVQRSIFKMLQTYSYRSLYGASRTSNKQI